VVSGSYRGELVESPVWDDDAGCLLFVDVLNGVGRLVGLDSSETVTTWKTPNWRVLRASERCESALRARYERCELRALRASCASCEQQAARCSLQAASERASSVQPSCRVGCVALRERGGLVAALAVNADHSGGVLCGLTLSHDADAAVCEPIVPLPLEPSSCPNDGAVDARGRCAPSTAMHSCTDHAHR
jgi:sugar lactone lactonase YvrE